MFQLKGGSVSEVIELSGSIWRAKKSVWFEAKRNLLQGSDWAMVSSSPAAISNTLRIGISMKIFAQPGLIPCNESRRGSLGKESLMKEARRGSAALIDIKPGSPQLCICHQFLSYFYFLNLCHLLM